MRSTGTAAADPTDRSHTLTRTFAPALVLDPAALRLQAGMGTTHAMLTALAGNASTTVTYSEPSADDHDGTTITGTLHVGALDVDYIDRPGFCINVTDLASGDFIAASLRVQGDGSLSPACWTDGAVIIVH